MNVLSDVYENGLKKLRTDGSEMFFNKDSNSELEFGIPGIRDSGFRIRIIRLFCEKYCDRSVNRLFEEKLLIIRENKNKSVFKIRSRIRRI